MEKTSTKLFRIFNRPELDKRFRYIGYQFSLFLYLFIRIFVHAGLIAPNHPCANMANVGKYGFSHIIGLAFSNIQWNRNGLAQIMIFLAVMLSMAVAVVSLVLLLLQLIFQTGMAYAQTPPAIDQNARMFVNPAVDAGRETDWVYQLLSNIFGDTGLSYFAGSSGFNATWIHNALTSMLSFYSIAMMVIATIIIAYYITTALLETSAEGIPFGERFNLVWAPIRFVLALALLAPVSNGYNVAQLIVFQAADWGSGFASHIWATGLQAFGDQEVIGRPETSKGASFIRGFWLSSLCMSSWNQYVNDQSDTLKTDMIRVTTSVDTQKGGDGDKVKSVIYRFGNRLAPDYCGALRIPIVEQQVVVSNGLMKNQGARILQAKYQDIFYELSGGLATIGMASSTYGWGNPGGLVEKNENIGSGTGALNGVIATNPVVNTLTTQFSRPIPVGGTDLVGAISAGTLPSTISVPAASYVFTQFFNPESSLFNSTEFVYEHPYFNVTPNLQTVWLNEIFGEMLNDGLAQAKAVQEETANLMVEAGATQGWGQAGGYFMIIAQMNGSIQSAYNNRPAIVKLPELLTDKNSRPEAKGKFAQAVQWLFNQFTGFRGWLTGKEVVNKDKAAEFSYDVMKQGEQWWDNTANVTKEEDAVDSGGTVALESLTVEEGSKSGFGFSLKHLFQKTMAALNYALIGVVNTLIGMVDTYNPFAALSVLGLSLMTVGMTAMVAAIALTFGGLVPGAGYFFMAISGTIISAGLALYIVLPIIPYFYFTMAVISWAIGIFEAVVAMPLWALSFLKIDGEGIFPEESKSAMIIIFQIFLRPPMIIISLIGSMLVFSGTVIFLNLTYGQMMKGMLESAGIASPIMAIFLIIGYVYIVYSLAMSIFKMVDNIPNMIMDYMGIGGLTPMTDYDDPQGANEAAFLGMAAFLQNDVSGGLAQGKEKKAEEEELRKIWEQGREAERQRTFQKFAQHYGSEAEARRVINSMNEKNAPKDPFRGTDGDGI